MIGMQPGSIKSRIIELAIKRPMDLEDFCDKIADTRRYTVRHEVRKLETNGFLKVYEGYYTPTAKGLDAILRSGARNMGDLARETLLVFEDGDPLIIKTIAASLDRSMHDTRNSVRRLVDGGYVAVSNVAGSTLLEYRITEKGEKALGVQHDRVHNTDAIVAQAKATQCSFVFNLGN